MKMNLDQFLIHIIGIILFRFKLLHRFYSTDIFCLYEFRDIYYINFYTNNMFVRTKIKEPLRIHYLGAYTIPFNVLKISNYKEM